MNLTPEDFINPYETTSTSSLIQLANVTTIEREKNILPNDPNESSKIKKAMAFALGGRNFMKVISSDFKDQPLQRVQGKGVIYQGSRTLQPEELVHLVYGSFFFQSENIQEYDLKYNVEPFGTILFKISSNVKDIKMEQDSGNVIRRMVNLDDQYLLPGIFVRKGFSILKDTPLVLHLQGSDDVDYDSAVPNIIPSGDPKPFSGTSLKETPSIQSQTETPKESPIINGKKKYKFSGVIGSPNSGFFNQAESDQKGNNWVLSGGSVITDNDSKLGIVAFSTKKSSKHTVLLGKVVSGVISIDAVENRSLTILSASIEKINK